MIEIEKIKRAKMYIENLANGINPLDGSIIPEDDVINNIRISRCLFYVTELLQKMIANNNISPSNPKKIKKEPFYITDEQLQSFKYSNSPITASEFIRRINELIDTEKMRKFTYNSMVNTLLDMGFLEIDSSPQGNNKKRPTEDGKQLGITFQQQNFGDRSYYCSVYNLSAQQFIVDNIDAFIQSPKKEKLIPSEQHQNEPWYKDDEDMLKNLYSIGIPVSEIALKLGRTNKAIKARLKKLGLL